jgi:hypothetical protein
MAGRRGLALITVALALLAAPAPAMAISSTPASSWQTNGRVRAIAVAAGKIFIGGDFTSVRAPGASSGGVARNHLAAFSLKTGALMPWNPRANGTVTALRVNPAGTTIYVGGGFTTLGGKARAHIGAVTTSRSTIRKWHASTNGTVYGIAVSSTRVYFGGSFTKVRGVNRTRLAAVGTGSTAPLAAWRANPNSTVRALTISPSGKRVFVGGDFTRVNGRAHLHLIAVFTAGGLSTFRAHPSWPVTALRNNAKTLVVGGAGNGGHVAAYVSASGVRKWFAVTDGDVQGVALLGSVVIVGGHFNNYCRGATGTGNPLVCNNPTARRKLLSLSLGSGALGAWDPDVVGSTIGVSAVAAANGVEAGGAFTKVHGVNQQGFARFK